MEVDSTHSELSLKRHKVHQVVQCAKSPRHIQGNQDSQRRIFALVQHVDNLKLEKKVIKMVGMG